MSITSIIIITRHKPECLIGCIAYEKGSIETKTVMQCLLVTVACEE